VWYSGKVLWYGVVRSYGFGVRFGTMVGYGGTVLGYSRVELLGTDVVILRMFFEHSTPLLWCSSQDWEYAGTIRYPNAK
jgi:hypothetical protein